MTKQSNFIIKQYNCIKLRHLKVRSGEHIGISSKTKPSKERAIRDHLLNCSNDFTIMANRKNKFVIEIKENFYQSQNIWDKLLFSCQIVYYGKSSVSILLFMFLFTVLIVKSSHVLAEIYFVFLKESATTNLKGFQ